MMWTRLKNWPIIQMKKQQRPPIRGNRQLLIFRNHRIIIQVHRPTPPRPAHHREKQQTQHRIQRNLRIKTLKIKKQNHPRPMKKINQKMNQINKRISPMMMRNNKLGSQNLKTKNPHQKKNPLISRKNQRSQIRKNAEIRKNLMKNHLNGEQSLETRITRKIELLFYEKSHEQDRALPSPGLVL